MLDKIKYLRVEFNQSIDGDEIPYFRSAVAEKSGVEHILFHNHFEKNRFRYSYPLIQYKIINKLINLICIEEGVEEVEAFFSKADYNLRIGKRKEQFSVKQIQAQRYTVQVWDKYFDYTIIRWMALNNENHKKYLLIDSEIEKMQFLEKILTANILSFAKGVGIQIKKKIALQIISIDREYMINFKEMKAEAFSVSFRTNIFLPDYIGLGKGASLGYGVIKELNKKG